MEDNAFSEDKTLGEGADGRTAVCRHSGASPSTSKVPLGHPQAGLSRPGRLSHARQSRPRLSLGRRREVDGRSRRQRRVQLRTRKVAGSIRTERIQFAMQLQNLGNVWSEFVSRPASCRKIGGVSSRGVCGRGDGWLSSLIHPQVGNPTRAEHEKIRRTSPRRMIHPQTGKASLNAKPGEVTRRRSP